MPTLERHGRAEPHAVELQSAIAVGARECGLGVLTAAARPSHFGHQAHRVSQGDNAVPDLDPVPGHAGIAVVEARQAPAFHDRLHGLGVTAARAPWVATLDGDGQNDPADLPKLLAARDAGPADVKLYAGWRVNRQDTGSKKWASKWANGIRSRLLRDATPDTGCGTKLFERAAFLDLPWFDHMHRYLPALMQRAGWKTTSVPVNHRPRGAGASKYTNLGRALVGVRDLMGVAWLIKRSKLTDVRELE